MNEKVYRREFLRQFPKALQDDLRHVMSTPRGRKFMYRLIYERIGDFGCGLLDKSYTGHANETAFNEGRRLVGRELHVLLQMVTPNEYTAMMAEVLQEDLERRGVEDDG